jgi:urease accessory protein
VDDAVGPILVETLRVQGEAPVQGVLGGNRVVDSVIAVGEVGEPPADPGAATLLRLERGGYVVRAVARQAHTVDLDAVLSAAVESAQGQPGEVGAT